MGEAVRWQDAHQGQDALRLHDPRSAAGYGGLTAELRLSEFVAVYYKPVHLITRDARPRHVEEIDQSVKYWVRFTADPPLGAISVWHCRDFIVGLKSLPGRKYATLANNTIRKHAGAIQTILDLCGPPDRWHRDCLGLLEQVPYVARPPREEKPAEDCYSLAELLLLLENADAATLPVKINGKPISPGMYHRCIYALIFNAGPRIGGVMGATWKHFHGDHLWLPPRVAVKGRVGKRIELNEVAREAIERMRGYDAERIFPWPRKWPSSRHSLHDQHDLIRQCLSEGRRSVLAYHALRKLHTNELAAINGLACMKSLGHTNARTTVEHYTSQKVVAAAVAQLPHVPIARSRQTKLFD